jgi:hypothetical protein
MIVKCNDERCKHNYLARLRGGAGKARACKVVEPNFEETDFHGLLKCTNYERKVTDGKE